MKQAIVIREDLDMSPGKIAAQACHASLAAYRVTDKVSKTRWEMEGEKVVVLECKSLQELLDLKGKAKLLRLSYATVTDAGFTEVPSGTITALAIGPDQDAVIDKITGNLKSL